MSYPDPRYLGEVGEATATIRSVDQAPELVSPSGTRVHYLAKGTTTGGLFGLYRYEMGPNAGGPGPHFHRTVAESFYILSGSIVINDGARWVETRPGDFIHVPPGGIHGFRNDSDASASMLIHFAPGAPREAYFEGLARFAAEGKPSDEELATFYVLHDNHWVPAPEG